MPWLWRAPYEDISYLINRVRLKRSLGAAGSDHLDKIIGLGETSKKTILIIAKQTRLGSYRLNLEMLPGARKIVGSHLPQVADPQDGKPLFDTC